MGEQKRREVFSRANILRKQQEEQENNKQRVDELRKAFEAVGATENGEAVLKYLFLVCGGDMGTLRATKDGGISVESTFVTLGAKGVWEAARFNMSSDLIKKIERHNWEEQ